MAMRRIKSAGGLAALASLAACASVPDLGAMPRLADPASLGSVQTFGGAQTFGDTGARSGDWPAAAWWRSFGDPQLDALIGEALASSPDVAAAAARIRAAEAVAAQTGAARGVAVSLDASAGGQKQSRNLGIPPQFVPGGIQDVGRVAGNLSFDLDLWGRNRAALAAATGEARAAAVDADQARLLLATDIAAAYADLVRYFAERDVAVDAVAIRGQTERLTAQRVANGLDTRGELRQAQSRVPAARAEVAALDEQIALTRDRLAALVGAGPDRGRAIGRPRPSAAAAGLPDRLALDLVGRRPDLLSARLRAEAAASRIRVARADFYPNIDLSAVVGLQSLGLGRLASSGSTFGNFGPALSLPIFDGGRLKGAYRGARAQYDEAVARYDGALVGAVREAADAVTSLRALDVRLGEQRAAVAAGREAVGIARLRYEGGLANQLTVLSADDQLLAARRTLADLEARRFPLEVALVRALGGGFRAPETLGAR